MPVFQVFSGKFYSIPVPLRIFLFYHKHFLIQMYFLHWNIDGCNLLVKDIDICNIQFVFVFLSNIINMFSCVVCNWFLSYQFLMRILNYNYSRLTKRKMQEFIFKGLRLFPVGIYLVKVNNKDTRAMCEICSKLIMQTPERRQLHRAGVFTVNMKHILHLALMIWQLTLNM